MEMNILGINGLGIIPAACLVSEGKLIAFAEEERFNRFKGSDGLMPVKASAFCLQFAGLNLNDIDFIAFGWNANLYRFYMPYFFLERYIRRTPKLQGSTNVFRVLEELTKYQPGNIRRAIAEMFRAAGIQGKIPPVKFVPHHLAHAASTYYCSGYDMAHVLVMDGSGEDRCTTIFKGEGADLSLIKSFKIPDSLGWFYQSVTEFLGFLPNRHEGKVMALASYGSKDGPIYRKVSRLISYDAKGDYRYNSKYGFAGSHNYGRIFSDEMVKLLGKPRNHTEQLTDIHKNIAFSAQNILEEIAANKANNIAKLPDFNGKLCIAGGVSLNCKMNGVIAAQESIEEIYIPPVANDAGTAMGAALYVSRKMGFDPRFKLTHAYWGPQFSKEKILKVLIQSGVRFKEETEIEKSVAQLLYQGKIVGWFQGRMEAGSRALGARSILANPLIENMRDYINQKVKGRESWRPFAASILYEEREKFVVSSKESPFMALAFKVKESMADRIPAAIHIDKTTRPQFVKKEDNSKYWNLINEFGNISGVYALLNTSFNGSEEPIVCTPEQALKTFYASGMDFLAIDDFLVSK